MTTRLRSGLGLLLIALLLTIATGATAAPSRVDDRPGGGGPEVATPAPDLDGRSGEAAVGPAAGLSASDAPPRVDLVTVGVLVVLAAAVGVGVGMLPRGARYRRATAR